MLRIPQMITPMFVEGCRVRATKPTSRSIWPAQSLAQNVMCAPIIRLQHATGNYLDTA
jgi:hypothetical protein